MDRAFKLSNLAGGWLLLVLLSGVAVGQEPVKISVYQLFETDACGPAGYQKDQRCPLTMTPDRFQELLKNGRLWLVMKDTVVPPLSLRVPRPQLIHILSYSDISGHVDLPRREAALLVVDWPDRAPRDFRVERVPNKNMPTRRPYVRPEAHYLQRFYHEPLDHINPEYNVVWKVSGGSLRYEIRFVK